MTNDLFDNRRDFATPGGVYNATPSRIVFGAGSLAKVVEAVEAHGARRAVVVSTPGRQDLAKRVVSLLGARCCGIIPEAVSQVPIELARRGRMLAAEMKADCIVSVGGGASIGLGKGIALEYAKPIVAIPTTYAGSEMTGFCGITIDGVKRMHTSLNMLAATVIYDPELSVGLPLDVSMASAMNALAHCVDAVYVSTVSPIILAAAHEGAAVLMDAMPRVAADPRNLAARTDLLYGAYLAGAALTGGFAYQHGLAHTLGGSFGIAHGLSHALVLPHVAAYNKRHAPRELARLSQAMGVAELGPALFDLLKGIGLPTSLAEVGFQKGDIARAADITVETDNGLNPGPVTRADVEALLDDAYHGRRPS
jgi:alcohol dehydrogenase class IV